MSDALEADPLVSGDWHTRVDHIVETMRLTSMHTDPAEMVRVYTGRMRNWIHYDRMLSLTRRGVEPPSFLVARDSQRPQPIDPWLERDKLPKLRGGLLGDIVYSNRPHLLNDLRVDPSDSAAEFVAGFGSLIAVPVFDGGQALNTVVFMRKDRGAFDPEMLPQTVWSANLFGRATHSLVLSQEIARANAALRHEMQVIAELQRGLLPQELPRIPTLDIAAYYQPAAQAGGDYYDFFPLPGDRWGMLVADVSGHGSPAAVLMAITHTLAHTVPHPPTSPGQLLQYVNHHLAQRYTGDRGTFVTAFFGVYDPATRQLTYASAGHPPPRFRRCGSAADVRQLDGPVGMPLGILDDETYGEATIQLQPGDQIVCYTDGITEAFSAAGEMFGVKRLDAAFHACAADASDLIQTVLAQLQQFCGGREADDDRTLVLARVTG